MKKTQYPIPNSPKGYQKIPFLLTSCQNTDLQSNAGNSLKGLPDFTPQRVV